VENLRWCSELFSNSSVTKHWKNIFLTFFQHLREDTVAQHHLSHKTLKDKL